jgi:type III pantothenate kinase
MLVGAVHGYRGLVRELIQKLKLELWAAHLPVVATGGYGELIAARLPEITTVDPLLTLKGLQFVWEMTNSDKYWRRGSATDPRGAAETPEEGR